MASEVICGRSPVDVALDNAIISEKQIELFQEMARDHKVRYGFIPGWITEKIERYERQRDLSMSYALEYDAEIRG